MTHSNQVLAQLVFKAIAANQTSHIVLSPGSRNAPLIIESHCYPTLKKYSLVDERSAGFFALGLAMSSQKPVVLVCTSGSALLNYYPAIAEAFYSNIPLIVLSADRPKNLIDIGDGQTIRQEHVYQNHIAFSGSLDLENLNLSKATVQEAFKVLKQKKAPIHLNIPFAEPLYETTDESLVYLDLNVDIVPSNTLLDEKPWSFSDLETYAEIWNASAKKMVIVGVATPDDMLQTQLNHLAKDPSVIILTEATSNIYNALFINHIDRLIFPWSDKDFEQLKPEILITIGGQVVSKKIKSLLRKNPPAHHWHIDKYWSLDTYHVLTKHFDISPQLFFSQFFFLTKIRESPYQTNYLEINEERETKHVTFFENVPFSDINVYDLIQKNIPKKIHIHFSNSAAIRYAQFFSWRHAISVHCNRGTSGIDGSTSTAIGFSIEQKNPTLLITGDLSFFYDSNAFWHAYIPASFRVILVNNAGGGIFRFIPGPTSTQTLDFFETPHHLTAKNLCNMYNIQYEQAANGVDVLEKLHTFFNDSLQPKLLEIFTPSEKNAEILKNYFQTM